MALIKKTVLVCNKCKAESVAEPNMIIMGEDFFLCDKCMETLLNWIDVNPVTKEVTHHERDKTYAVWDDYNIKKMIGMIEEGVLKKDIANAFCVTPGAISHIINRIHKSSPGSNLHQYKKYFQGGSV